MNAPSPLHYDVIIIGAGAAGLMCAIQCKPHNKKILVLDHANKAGKKILMSGGGRCNFTNTATSPHHFISSNSHFCKSALSRYSPYDFIKLVEKHQIPYVEKAPGQLFCQNRSKDIVQMLLNECEQSQITIKLNTSICSIKKQLHGQFHIKTNQTIYCCDKLVIATGGLSIPTMGATAFAYQIAEQFDLPIIPTRAGLVPFTLHENDKQRLSQLSGISLACSVETNQQTFSEPMLFTHRGLSGPAMLQISSYWHPGENLQIDLSPNENIYEYFITMKQQSPNKQLSTCLESILPKRAVTHWLEYYDIDSKSIAGYNHASLKKISDYFHQWQIKPNNTEGYRTAEVTLGGVDTACLSSKTFEVKSVAGLYFIGEALDVTGWLGGYNFQWAWASAHAMASSI